MPFNQRNDVCRVQAIANLVPISSEADITHGPPAKPAVDPIGKDPLVGAPELSGSGENATPVHPHGKSKVAPYPSASCSLASLVAPYSETGAAVEKVSSTPWGVRPLGSGPRSSGTNALFATRMGSVASGAIA